jgi:hypothetical protein
VETVLALLRQGADSEATTFNEYTALHQLPLNAVEMNIRIPKNCDLFSDFGVNSPDNPHPYLATRPKANVHRRMQAHADVSPVTLRRIRNDAHFLQNGLSLGSCPNRPKLNISEV